MSGTLLKVDQKGIVDLFSRAESRPQGENSGEDTESQPAGERAQPCSHARREMSQRTTPPVKDHRQKPSGQHAQPSRLADDDYENACHQRNSSRGQSPMPFHSGL